MEQAAKAVAQSPVAKYDIATVVNNLPAELDSLLSKAFQCQREYSNETKFRVAFLSDAIVSQSKYIARNAIITWESCIAKCQKLHKEFNREQAIEFLRETRTGKELEELATVAEVVRQELS